VATVPNALPALDLLSALLLGALSVALSLEGGWPSFTLLWMIGAALLLYRLRPGPERERRAALRRAWSAAPLRLPLLSLALDLALLLALRELERWPLLLALNLSWAALMLLARLALGPARPLAIGVFEHTRRSGALPALPGDALRYLSIPAGSAQPLVGVDVLLYEHDLQAVDYRRLIAHANATGLPIWSRTALEEDLGGKVLLEQMNTEWMRTVNFQSGYSPFKRALDLLFTLLLLPLLLPLLALVALLVWRDVGRPVLFWQERIGRSGVPFRLVKFRTMRRDSEAAGPAFAASADARVTPLGALLRKYRLDELPQFWNVLRGEMSILGPRPEQFAFAADFEESIPLYPLRHWVRPGISGWAQVNQGYAADLGQTVEKLRYDLYYVKHLSPGLDLKIVFRTLYTILTGFGAR
jgi:lipopolysaccharide/colanic/teichoic acid biosynthesis glycosyltransferase